MGKPGRIFKTCGCRDDARRRLGEKCPRLTDRAHGSWYFHCSAPNMLGGSERARRGGYPSKAAAGRARDAWLAATGEERTAHGWTVEQWLRYWLSNHTTIRPTTLLHYTRDVERVLIPWLGGTRLADLDGRRLRTVFAEIAKTTNTKGQSQSASAMQHLRTTLRAALNRGTVRAAAQLHHGGLQPPQPHRARPRTTGIPALAQRQRPPPQRSRRPTPRTRPHPQRTSTPLGTPPPESSLTSNPVNVHGQRTSCTVHVQAASQVPRTV
jgi:hypothetical protein